MKATRASAAKRARHGEPRTSRNTSARRRTATGDRPAAARAPGGPDQFGAIVAKGLDLAEASLSLGLTVINRVGTAAQHQMERMISNVPQEPAPQDPAGHTYAAQPPPGPAAPPMGAPAMSTAVAPEEPQYAITNRIPAAPGGRVRIPFSINNDSVSSSKTVLLKAVGFTGELEGAQIDAEHFVVKPERRRIAPMDFEKFVLEGTIPAHLPSDVYHGAIVVSSGHELSIPVRVVVQAT